VERREASAPIARGASHAHQRGSLQGAPSGAPLPLTFGGGKKEGAPRADQTIGAAERWLAR
jgi:hypothetical protein